LLNISPNEFPASRYSVKREGSDDTPVEFVQDPESNPSSAPSFLLRLQNDDDLIFNFTFVVRQPPGSNAPVEPPLYNGPMDTTINGLTFIFAASSRELDNLVTKELHADPNLHKNNANVQLVGDYSTGGSSSVQFQWSWKWKPPRAPEDRAKGWRTCCSFVEYDQRNHRLDPLASFSFWVTGAQRPTSSPKSPGPRLEPGSTVKLRVPSAQSIESRISDSDTEAGIPPPLSPTIEPIMEDDLDLEPTYTSSASTKVDVSCQRPGDDATTVEDGPLFRATMKAMELKTGNMRARWKKVLKKAESAYEAQTASNAAFAGLIEALRDASTSNAHAVQPAIEHYFDKISKEILVNEKRNTAGLQKLIIDPVSKLYNNDIKQAESKKRDFEEESKEYYQFLGRYLGQRQDSLKEKKRIETDGKYQVRRRNFELKRFDYSSYLQDLHGGRKDQEVLSNLTRYADAQAKGYLETARKIENLLPRLEALNSEVREADKDFQLHRTEREEKRRALEQSAPTFAQPEGAYQGPTLGPSVTGSLRIGRQGDLVETPRSVPSIPGRSASQSKPVAGTQSIPTLPFASSQDAAGLSSSPSNKFKGIRDLEERDYSAFDGPDGAPAGYKKEGLVWALSRPGSHADPKGLNKQAWHK
jgi:Arf-GAP/SH3 domain/ANK repeat/PH domain-containing protein